MSKVQNTEPKFMEHYPKRATFRKTGEQYDLDSTGYRTSKLISWTLAYNEHFRARGLDDPQAKEYLDDAMNRVFEIKDDLPGYITDRVRVMPKVERELQGIRNAMIAAENRLAALGIKERSVHSKEREIYKQFLERRAPTKNDRKKHLFSAEHFAEQIDIALPPRPPSPQQSVANARNFDELPDIGTLTPPEATPTPAQPPAPAPPLNPSPTLQTSQQLERQEVRTPRGFWARAWSFITDIPSNIAIFFRNIGNIFRSNSPVTQSQPGSNTSTQHNRQKKDESPGNLSPTRTPGQHISKTKEQSAKRGV